MYKNSNLFKAKAQKQDEFYTQLEDIEKELFHYKDHFKDKVILCNCDDPFESNFFKYFAINFNYLGLKKLICIGYENSPFSGSQVSFFGENKPAHVMEITEVKDYNNDKREDLADIEYLLRNNKNTLKELKGDGDFRSQECIEYLKEADIVVTNPPFSLFRDYLKQLIDYDKKFIIIGNQNAITYKEVFPLIKDNKVWTGYNYGDMSFKVPADYPEKKTRYWVDETGQKWRSMGNISWFTNLDIPKRHEALDLYKKYNPEEYPTYDNSKIINVNKIAEIPKDYFDIMGVPITYFEKHSTDQFEILGLANSARYLGDIECLTLINGQKIYNRIFIKRK